AEQFRRLAEGGPDFIVEKRYVRRDGSKVWVNNSVSAIRDKTGAVRGIVAVVVGVDERKQAQSDAGFPADLDERIRLAERAEELMAEVSRLAGEYFGASRCYFAEVFEGADRWTISRDYHVGRPSIAGEYPVSAFPPGALRRLGKGRTLV